MQAWTFLCSVNHICTIFTLMTNECLQGFDASVVRLLFSSCKRKHRRAGLEHRGWVGLSKLPCCFGGLWIENKRMWLSVNIFSGSPITYHSENICIMHIGSAQTNPLSVTYYHSILIVALKQSNSFFSIFKLSSWFSSLRNTAIISIVGPMLSALQCLKVTYYVTVTVIANRNEFIGQI